MKKIVLYSIILMLFLKTNLYGHGEWVHQWMVLQAWELLKQQVPEFINTPLALKIGGMGGNYYKSVEGFWNNQSVTGGAWAEDITDAIVVANNANETTVTSTHFWLADFGDWTNTVVIASEFDNAYSKANWMYYGSPTIIDRYGPTAYQETFSMVDGGVYTVPFYSYGIVFQYDGLANLYKSKKIKILGYFLATLGSFPPGDWNAHQSGSIYKHLDTPIEVYLSPARVDKFVWNILGRIAHLLGDMSVPAHVKNAYQHPQGLPTAIIHPCELINNYNLGDTFEKWMSSPTGNTGCYTQMPSSFNAQDWTYLHPNAQLGYLNVVETANPLRNLFYSLNQITQYFPNQNVGGSFWSGNADIYGGSNQGSSLFQGDDYSIIASTLQNYTNPPQIVDFDEIADVTFSFAIRASAGLLFLFASDAGILPKLTADNNFIASGNTNRGTMEIDGINRTIPLTGYTFLKNIGQNVNLSANSPQNDNQNYQRIWHTGATNPSDWRRGGEFKSNNQTYSFTVAADDNNKRYVANLRKNYAVTRNDQTEFDGIQSPGIVTHVVELNTGQITAPTQQTINNKTYQFAGWVTGESNNTLTITPTGNDTYTALYKLPHHSNQNVAFNNNSQRKIVRSEDGKLHMVYESMGYVWYERSTDGGTSWQIMNNGNPVDINPGKSPSLDVLYDNQPLIYIVYQTYTSSTNLDAAIKVAHFLETQLQFINTVDFDYVHHRDFYSVDFNPVVAKILSGKIMVAWEDSKICYRIGNYANGGFSWGNTEFTDNSESEKKTPTIASYKSTPNGVFHLAWQDGYMSIKYQSFTLQNNGTFAISSIKNISKGCGFPTNYAPSINVWGNNNVNLVWIGTPYYGSSYRKVINRNKSGERDWPFTFGQYGNEALSPVCAAAVVANNDIIAWSENPSPNTYTNKFLKWGSVKTAATSGRGIQLFNTNQLHEMFISSFESSTAPYYINQSANLYSINKEKSDLTMAQGTQIVVIKDDVEIYFRIGDLRFNDVPLILNKVSDQNEDGILTLEEIHNSCLSIPFYGSESDNLDYSIEYGVTDSLKSLQVFGEDGYVNIKVEMINIETGEVIAELNKITLNKNNVRKLNEGTFYYSIMGIPVSQTAIKVNIENNIDPKYAAAEIKSDRTVLLKGNIVKLNLNVNEKPTEYALYQNYPNPFNPVTTITYQIPKEGLVTLKIYDILGKEVTTLLNEEKQAGKYSIEFNASKLSSGVYLYELRSNEYKSTKKLLLMK